MISHLIRGASIAIYFLVSDFLFFMFINWPSNSTAQAIMVLCAALGRLTLLSDPRRASARLARPSESATERAGARRSLETPLSLWRSERCGIHPRKFLYIISRNLGLENCFSFYQSMGDSRDGEWDIFGKCGTIPHAR